MEHYRARRARRPSPFVRIARVAVPATAVALLGGGVTWASQPGRSTTVAVPAPSPTVPAAWASASTSPSTSGRERVSRSARRPVPARPSATPNATRSPATAITTPTTAAASPTRSQPTHPAVDSTKAVRRYTTAAPRTAAARPTRSQPTHPAVDLTKTVRRYTTTALNVRTGPGASYGVVTVLGAGSRVAATTVVSGGWVAIAYSGQVRWTRAGYLSPTQPHTVSKPTSSSSARSRSVPTQSGIASAGCRSGSGVEAGLQPDAIKVHRAICARFPQITSYSGVRPDPLPEHPSGRALDSMLPDYTSAAGRALGWQIATWVRANAASRGVSQVIFAQHIWTVQRSSEGWRLMPDRGSDTANHFNHVHVTVYGNAAR